MKEQLNLTPQGWFAVCCGFAIATWQQIPYADRVLMILMIIDLLVGALNAARLREFQMHKLFFGFASKLIVFSALLAVHAVEPMIPEGVSVDIDKWFATGLCGYEFVSIFKTYTDATGRSSSIATWVQDRLGGKELPTDATGRHIAVKADHPPAV